MNKPDDTIAAISTPPGEGGIGIVRLSGVEAFRIAGDIFRSQSAHDLEVLSSHTVNHGLVVDPESGDVIDEVLLTPMRGPRTYTKEDIIEINCHSGRVPLRRILELCLSGGARLAEEGEFTKRAFLNGRIDLAQAEAVIDIIKAKTDLGGRAAMDQLSGGLSTKVNDLRNRIKEMLAHIEAWVDFPEEDIDELPYEDIITRSEGLVAEVEDLIESADRGKILREGIKVAIAGRPNVGKSSLLNALLREERAIVTPIPGTTRDTIEESLNIKGIPINLIDTAGIRRTEDIVEKEGVTRSWKFIEDADLVLWVLDCSEELSSEDQSILGRVPGGKTVAVLNKIDLKRRVDLEKIKEFYPTTVDVSATKGWGLDQLEETIYNLFLGGEMSSSDRTLVTNVRHKDALRRAKESLINVIETARNGLSGEFLALDLRGALRNLGEIVGETTTEDILDVIFSQFCIGK